MADLISVQDALALAAQIPTITDGDGAVRRCMAITIARPKTTDPWTVQCMRHAEFTVNGKVVKEKLQAHSHSVNDVAGMTVEIGGYTIPVILAHAILGAYYCQLETDEINAQ